MKWVVMILVVIVVGAVGAYWYEGFDAQRTLLKQPAYRVIEKHDSALFDKLVEEYKVFARGESRREDFVNFANYEVSLAATQHLAHASQDSIIGLVRDMLSTARKLEKAPDNACFRYWFPQVAGPPDVAKYVDADSQAHTLDLMGEVIRSAEESPVPLPDSELVKNNLASVINATYEQYGADAQMISHADDARIDRTKVCTMTNSIYDRILAMPPDQGADVIRAMTQVR